MMAWLAIEIRIIQFRQLPSHCHAATTFDLTSGSLCDDFRGKDSQLAETLFIASGLSHPNLLRVRKLIKWGVESGLGHVQGCKTCDESGVVASPGMKTKLELSIAEAAK